MVTSARLRPVANDHVDGLVARRCGKIASDLRIGANCQGCRHHQEKNCLADHVAGPRGHVKSTREAISKTPLSPAISEFRVLNGDSRYGTSCPANAGAQGEAT